MGKEPPALSAEVKAVKAVSAAYAPSVGAAEERIAGVVLWRRFFHLPR